MCLGQTVFLSIDGASTRLDSVTPRGITVCHPNRGRQFRHRAHIGGPYDRDHDPFALSPSEQPKHSELASTCHENFSIHHCRNRESNRGPKMIASPGLIAIVEFPGNV